MSYESDLDDLMRERKARKSGDAVPSGSNGVALGKIDVKHIAVPANKVIHLPDGTVIVREKGSDT